MPLQWYRFRISQWEAFTVDDWDTFLVSGPNTGNIVEATDSFSQFVTAQQSSSLIDASQVGRTRIEAQAKG